jgi:hypothetical protein
MNLKTITKLTAAVAVFGFTMATQATAINYSTPGVVGSVDPGSPASLANDVIYVNNLLGVVGANTTTTISGHVYHTGATDYSGSVSAVGAFLGGTDTSTTVNYTWVIAKYGDTDVVFNMADFGGPLPTSGENIVVNQNGGGLGISGWSGFGGSRVPDGGATVALLGLGIAGLGAMRRKLS